MWEWGDIPQCVGVRDHSDNAPIPRINQVKELTMKGSGMTCSV